MNTVKSIKEFIDQNPNVQLRDLHYEYQMDMISILIGAVLAKLEYKEILRSVQKNTSENELADLIEQLIEYPELLEKIIPQNVHIATIIFLYLNNPSKSKEMIQNIKHEIDYLIQIKNENLFESEILVFSLQPSLRSPDLTEIIKDQIKQLDVVFLEPAYKDFFSHFDLNEFLNFDKKSEESFIEILKDYIDDAIFPAVLQQKAVIEKSDIKVFFDTNFLKESILGLQNLSVNYKKTGEDFLKMLKDDVADELLESTVKYAITNSWGFGLLDLSIKTVKIFILSLHKNSESLIENVIKENYTLFVSSGEENVKSWFVKKKNKEFKDALKESGFVNEPEISEKFFDPYYDKFIERYFIMYGMIDGVKSLPEDHTEIFRAVYENTFNLNIRVGSF